MIWWWVHVSKDGRNFILGPFPSDTEAEVRVKKLNPTAYKLYQFPTQDEARATRMLKAAISRTQQINHAV